jgi:hypothetical protein
MSRKHPIDDQFRKKLNQHEVQPDPKIWENISGAIQKKSKPNGMLWTGAIISLALVAVAAWYFADPLFADRSLAEKESRSVISEEAGESFPSEMSSAYTDPSEINQENASSLNESHLKNNQDESNYPSAHLMATESASVQVESSSIKAEAQQEKAEPQTSRNEQASNNTQGNKFSKEATNTTPEVAQSPQSNNLMQPFLTEQMNHDETLSSAPEFGTMASEEKSLSSDKLIQRSNQKSALLGSYGDRSILARAWATDELEAVNDQTAGFRAFQVSRFKRIEQSQKSLLDKIDICALTNPKTNECPTFGTLRKRYQIDLYATTGLLLQSLGTNEPAGSEWTTHLQERRASESGAWSIGMGVRLGTQFSNGVALRGGIQISRGQVRLDYNDETQRREVINVSVDTIVDGQGNTVVIWDTLSRQVTGIIPRTEFNDFTQVDIPLTVGYTFLGRDYDVELNGGIMLNAMFRRSGRIFGPGEADFVSIDSDAPDALNAYKSKLGLSFIISAALNYHLTDQYSVFIEPQLRYYNEAVSPDNYFLQEQWFNINMQLGARYSF